MEGKFLTLTINPGSNTCATSQGYVTYAQDSSVGVPEMVSDPMKPMSGFAKGAGDSNHVINNSCHSILPALKKYDFDESIKNMAEVVYHKMRYQMHRKKVWNQLLYHCVYNAHLELGIVPDPYDLGTKFGLTKRAIQECDSKFSYLQTGYKPPVVYTTPLDYLFHYGKQMDMNVEAVQDIVAFATGIVNKRPTLLEKNPQTVALAMLKYYFETHGIIASKIEGVTNRPTATIETMYREIVSIDNS